MADKRGGRIDKSKYLLEDDVTDDEVVMPDYSSEETESGSEIHIYDVEEYREEEEMESDGAIARRLQEQYNREGGLHPEGSSVRRVGDATKEYVAIAPAPARSGSGPRRFARSLRSSALLIWFLQISESFTSATPILVHPCQRDTVSTAIGALSDGLYAAERQHLARTAKIAAFAATGRLDPLQATLKEIQQCTLV